jgi:hypothetical protein
MEIPGELNPDFHDTVEPDTRPTCSVPTKSRQPTRAITSELPTITSWSNSMASADPSAARASVHEVTETVLEMTHP